MDTSGLSLSPVKWSSDRLFCQSYLNRRKRANRKGSVEGTVLEEELPDAKVFQGPVDQFISATAVVGLDGALCCNEPTTGIEQLVDYPPRPRLV